MTSAPLRCISLPPLDDYILARSCRFVKGFCKLFLFFILHPARLRFGRGRFFVPALRSLWQLYCSTFRAWCQEGLKKICNFFSALPLNYLRLQTLLSMVAHLRGGLAILAKCLNPLDDYSIAHLRYFVKSFFKLFLFFILNAHSSVVWARAFALALRPLDSYNISFFVLKVKTVF